MNFNQMNSNGIVKKNIDKITLVKQKKNGYNLNQNKFFQAYEQKNNMNIINVTPPSTIIKQDYLLQNSRHVNVESANNNTEILKKLNNIVTWYKNKIHIKNTKFIPKQEYVEIIPKKIFVCWKTKNLPEHMRLNVKNLKETHPRFEVNLFDDNDCVIFIRNYFDTDIVNAFLYLKPGAFKADLFRLCVLYIHGGIYIDIKYRCINGFKFDYLLNNEYLVLDVPSVHWNENMNGIYNGLMVSKPKNGFLFECIQGIVKNVKNKYYGTYPLFPTGPGLLGDIYFKDCNTEPEFVKKVKEFEYIFHYNIVNIIIQNTAVLEIYPEYRIEQKESCPNNYYYDLWYNNDIYNTEIESSNFIKEISVNNIPFNIFQTWSSKENIPTEIQQYINTLKEQNPEFNYQLYGDKECEEYIQNNFESTILQTFRKLIPGAYKADLFRYCILYKLGGIYLDIKYFGVNGFKLIYLTDKEYFVRDIESSGYGIYNAFIVSYPGNLILKNAIYKIVENVKNDYYGPNYFYPTGPLLLKPYFESIELELVHREVIDTNKEKKYYISYRNGENILYYNYKEYRNIQSQESKKHYAYLWKEKAIYN